MSPEHPPEPTAIYRMVLPSPPITLAGAASGAATIEDSLRFENVSLRLVCADLRAQVLALTHQLAQGGGPA